VGVQALEAYHSWRGGWRCIGGLSFMKGVGDDALEAYHSWRVWVWQCIGPFADGGGIPMLPWPGGGGQGSQAPRDGNPTQCWRSTWQKCTRPILLCIRIAGLQHALCIPHPHMEKQHELNESQNSVHLTLPHVKTGKDRNTFGAWLAIQGNNKCWQKSLGFPDCKATHITLKQSREGCGPCRSTMMFPLSIVFVAYDTVIAWLHKYCPSMAYMPPLNLKFLYSPYSCYNRRHTDMQKLHGDNNSRGYSHKANQQAHQSINIA
jgi:hypothetical protein